ncbi:hypothetical protein PR048_021591 [Dryococelus australis]|uniref:Reverse transcriptase Ty1/copia-type domain-containing protein n=1 Tax=Dryococelus australis TaxID=614101 RepID=A0ABQ9GYM3_9NEOP|nr:hypothetical protein PR048_021591 [Dryococelus australis]
MMTLNAETGTFENVREDVQPRQSARIRKILDGEKFCSCCNLSVYTAYYVEEPISVTEALKGEYADECRDAIKMELGSIQSKRTYVLVDRPADRTILHSKWVLKLKKNPDGAISRFKARLLVQGFAQVQRIDFHETYAPVIKRKIIRLMMALTVLNEWVQEHIDVLTAYLHTDLSEEIYMVQPKHLEVHDKSQSGTEWHGTLNTVLRDLGLKRLEKDPCVYVDLFIGIYVDDLGCWGKKKHVEWFKEELGVKVEIRKLGNMTHFFSINAEYCNGKMSIHQTDYITQILRKFNLEDGKGRSAPLEEDNGFIIVLIHNYQASYSVCIRRVVTLQKETGKDVKHIMLYLNKTQNLKLTFISTHDHVNLFYDADFANGRDRILVNGYVATMANAPVSWKTRLPKKRDPVATSTTEVKYASMFYAAKEALWVKQIVTELGQTKFLPKLFIIKCDNQGAIKLTENSCDTELSKSFDISTNSVGIMLRREL